MTEQSRATEICRKLEIGSAHVMVALANPNRILEQIDRGADDASIDKAIRENVFECHEQEGRLIIPLDNNLKRIHLAGPFSQNLSNADPTGVNPITDEYWNKDMDGRYIGALDMVVDRLSGRFGDLAPQSLQFSTGWSSGENASFYSYQLAVNTEDGQVTIDFGGEQIQIDPLTPLLLPEGLFTKPSDGAKFIKLSPMAKDDAIALEVSFVDKDEVSPEQAAKAFERRDGYSMKLFGSQPQKAERARGGPLGFLKKLAGGKWRGV